MLSYIVSIRTKMSSEAQQDSIKDGKQRDEILFSFKVIGIVEIALGIWLLLLGILTLIFACVNYSWGNRLSRSGYGIWCGLFSIPAGILSISTSSKVTYFSVGWSFICSMIGSFFSVMLCILSMAGGILSLSNGFSIVVVFNVVLFMFGVPQLVLCSYSSVVFGRLYYSYPYYVCHQDYLFPCFYMIPSQPNFANVMYSTLNAKKHDY